MNKEQYIKMIKDIDILVVENDKNTKNFENFKEIINERLTQIESRKKELQSMKEQYQEK